MKSKRVFHYISKNENKEIPHHIILVDTETRIERIAQFHNKQTFRLGFAIYLRWDSRQKEYVESSHELWNVGDFHNLLDSISMPKRKVVIFSHNSSFDYTILMMDTYFSSRKFEITMRTIDHVFLIKAFKNDGEGRYSIIYSDTMNYYKMSLEKLGSIFGEYKMGKPDFDNVSDSDLMRYCKQDVKVLSTLMKKHIGFISTHDLGNFKLTIASQAFNAFRHRFMNEKILVHTNDDIIQMELDSYRGGRCEAFIIGKKFNVFKLDVNSMYPYVMKHFKYPIVPNSKYPLVNMELDEVAHLIKSGKYCLAECDFVLHKPAIAVKTEKLIFPIGRVRQVLTSPEIEYILEHEEIGKIVRFNKCVFYEQANIFSEYVDYFYNFRKSTTNLAYQAMAKLFLNSLYGKFGQKSLSITSLVEDEETKSRIFDAMDAVCSNVMEELIEDKSSRYVRLGGDLYQVSQSGDILANDSVPIIASTVTAFARRYLFELMNMAGLDSVYYCDTDSLFVSEDGYNRLEKSGVISDSVLGKLKLEDKGNVEIFGAKNYSFNGEVKLKGVKKDAIQIGKNQYLQSQFVTKNMRYIKGIPDGVIMVLPMIKNISESYDKGIVENGVVKPFYYSDFDWEPINT